MPVVRTWMLSAAKTASNARVYLLSRSLIRCVTVAPVSCGSMTRFRAAWVTQSAVGCAVMPRLRMRRLVCSMTAKRYMLALFRVVAVNKSQARIAWAWLCRKVAQVWWSRSGAGSIPCCFRISHTVEGATLMPRAASSPWMRR